MTEKFMRRSVALLVLLAFTLSMPGALNRAFAQVAKPDKSTTETAIKQTRLLVEEVIKASYPELTKADIQVNTFSDDADYFRTLFSFNRFLLGRKMRYFIRVNPRLFALAAPEAGVRAIIAHELGHVLDFQSKSRINLLRLVRLSSKGYTARFERRTDLQAIARGYGDGLKAYRLWLYRQVPAKKLAEKRRNYFSPEEIDAIQAKLKTHPSQMDHWLKNVPLKLEDIGAHN